MKRVFFLLAVILYQNGFAQTNNKIDLFVFDNGSLKQKNGSTNSLSTAGQSIIGTLKGNNNIIITGFSPELIFGNIITSSEGEDNIQPKDFSLFQNYPNPFNPSTNIEFRIANLPDGKAGFGFVNLKVYDILGREVMTLVNEEKPTGTYKIKFDASGLASGIYLYRLQAGSFNEVKKMILMK